MTHMFRTFVSGLILLLPLIITLAVVAWLGQFIITYVGPSSVVGQALMTIGFGFSASQFVAYVIGSFCSWWSSICSASRSSPGCAAICRSFWIRPCGESR
jgi:uncharacterized membrane protein